MPDVFRCFRCEYSCAYFHYPIARMRLRVHRAPGIPRALFFKGRKLPRQNLGRLAPRSNVPCVQWRGMTPQSRPSSSGLAGRSSIPEASGMKRISRGVLDAPHARSITAVHNARLFGPSRADCPSDADASARMQPLPLLCLRPKLPPPGPSHDRRFMAKRTANPAPLPRFLLLLTDKQCLERPHRESPP